jgi:stage V sporulation protein G
MEITEVRIKLMEDSDDRLRAFCSITFDDCFVVRDLKIIDGTSGPFVAMPSRKLTSHCPSCGAKNHLRSAYCNQCGSRLPQERSQRESDGRVKLYADIAHPVNSECREMIQDRVIAEYEAELDRSYQPGYTSRYDDTYEDEDGRDSQPFEEVSEAAAPSRADAQIQPAEATPPPPHRPRQQTTSPTRKTSRSDDEFGAGIFD